MAKIAGKDPVPLWRLFLRMGGWFFIAFAIPLLILTLISNWQLTIAERFESEGRQTTAIVTERYFTESTDSDGDRTVTYYFTLDYITDRGEEINLTRSVSSTLYNTTKVGDEIPIWYLETEPDRTEMRQGEHKSGSVVAQVIGLIFGVLALGSLWYSGGRAVAAVRARRYGAREKAQVIGVHSTNVKVNGKYRYRLSWREDSGRTGQSLMYREDDLRGIGPEITVYQGIKRAWWTGDVGERTTE